MESNARILVGLENAITQVETARTLKNAMELMKGNKTIQFFLVFRNDFENYSFVTGTDHFKKK